MNTNARIERTLPSQTTQLDPGLSLVAELIGLLQMHRGASLAALGGVDGFHKRASDLHPQIDSLIEKVAYQAIQTDASQWQIITGEWENTRKHWRKDNALSNFEIHNYLIEQCHRLLWRYVEGQSRDADKETEGFLFRDIPLHIEGLGQLRGLSSYALAQKAEPDIVAACKPRVAQLSKQTHLSLVETQRQLIKLANKNMGERSTLLPTLQARIRLSGQFLQGVQDQLSAQPHNTIKPENIFQLGTLAIEANQKVWSELARICHQPHPITHH